MGIYVIVELAHDCPTCAITRDPVPHCYPKELKLQGQRIIHQFTKYNNTLAFSVGNEVNHYTPPNQPQWNAPCQKKFIYDMKQYIDTCYYKNRNKQRGIVPRKVPIGLVSADHDRITLAQYYAMSETENGYDVPDWYGLNIYLYCDGNVTTYSNSGGFHDMVDQFDQAQLPFPIILTEFGCLSLSFPNVTIISNNETDSSNDTDTYDTLVGENYRTILWHEMDHGNDTMDHPDDNNNIVVVDVYEGQRTFLQAYWLLNEPIVQKVLAGGLVFEYSMEMENAKTSSSPYPFYKFGSQNYGLGYFSPSNCDDYHILCHYNPYPEFYNLRDMYRTVTTMYYDKDNNNDTTHHDAVKKNNTTTYPQQFPHFTSYQWESDHWYTMTCFQDESSDSSPWLFGFLHSDYDILLEPFHCPTMNNSPEWDVIRISNGSDGTSRIKNPTNQIPFHVWIGSVLLLVLIGFVTYCLLQSKNRMVGMTCNKKNDEKDINQNNMPTIQRIKPNQDVDEAVPLLSREGKHPPLSSNVDRVDRSRRDYQSIHRI
jgi:Glucanosyltransferase